MHRTQKHGCSLFWWITYFLFILIADRMYLATQGLFFLKQLGGNYGVYGNLQEYVTLLYTKCSLCQKIIPDSNFTAYSASVLSQIRWYGSNEIFLQWLYLPFGFHLVFILILLIRVRNWKTVVNKQLAKFKLPVYIDFCGGKVTNNFHSIVDTDLYIFSFPILPYARRI